MKATELPKNKSANRPELVVLIVIDQWPSWSFDSDKEHMTGGIAKMMTEGAFNPRIEIPYALPLTGPGHATLGSGALPMQHGIVANRWFENGKMVAAGAGAGAPYSQLQTEGLAKAWRNKFPGGKVIAIGGKGRAATLVTGKRPDLALWYEADKSGMASHSAYPLHQKAWVKELTSEKLPNKFEWKPRSSEKLASMAGEHVDDALGEGEVDHLTRAFPHDLSQTQSPHKRVRATPALDRLLFSTARKAIENELLDVNETSLLGLSLSAHDYAGHIWGQESWERREVLLRADEGLGDFLSFLQQHYGKNFTVVLTSDHGATPLVENSISKGHDASRILAKDVFAVADAAARSVLGTPKTTWVLGVLSPNVFLSDELKNHPRFKEAKAAMLSALVGVKNIQDVIDTASFSDCNELAGVKLAVCKTTFSGRTGDLFLLPTPLSWTSNGYRSGTHHNAPHNYEREIPLLIYSPSRPQWAECIAQSINKNVDVAHAIATSFGIPLENRENVGKQCGI